MAKSTRQDVFEGMAVSPVALAAFVEKRLESAFAGDWRDRVAERFPALRFAADGRIGWDRVPPLNAMDRFWGEAFKTVPGRAARAPDSMRRLTEASAAAHPLLLRRLLLPPPPAVGQAVAETWASSVQECSKARAMERRFTPAGERPL